MYRPIRYLRATEAGATACVSENGKMEGTKRGHGTARRLGGPARGAAAAGARRAHMAMVIHDFAAPYCSAVNGDT